MTDEERQRQMDFIVDQQAQFTVRLDQLAEKVNSLADSQLRAEERWTKTEGGIRALLAIAELHEQEIKAHELLISANSRQIAANTKQITLLQEAGRENEERLNVFINTVARLISERRDGGPRQG
ncbi:MAG: hypothetical protein M3416_21860 [Acidobacteriota bacterium]|nr:hypothetical protein [Acidobacteriota bacterium]